MTEKKKIFKVGELTRFIKRTLEGSVGSVWLEGELSNVRRPASGHYYLTVKDESSQISAVLFRGNQRGLTFQPADGQKVRLYGDITVYEPGGNYQIIVRSMEEAGKGALQERFEKLKAALNREGLFAPERKKPLPLLPQHIGIVTSRTGAAIRDILNVIERRFPNLHVVLAPVKVQGEGAAEEIASAIRELNERGGLDVLIVGRGGGSLEDLWCFNEECVARAIAASSLPVISAVGHEIDFTISDFVADLRAPTPSAAAELVVGRKEEFEESLERCSQDMLAALREKYLMARNRLLAAERSYAFREPGNIVKQQLQRIDNHEMRMASALTGSLQDARAEIDRCGIRSAHAMEFVLRDVRAALDRNGMKAGHALEFSMQKSRQRIDRCEEQLKALSPLAVLNRGYSITTDDDGTAVRDPEELSKGQLVKTRVAKGSFESTVK